MSFKLIILSACLLLTASVIAAIDPSPDKDMPRIHANSDEM